MRNEHMTLSQIEWETVSDNGDVKPLGEAGVNTRVSKQFRIPRKVKLYERVR